MAESFDVLIPGAGIVGSACAYQCAQAGLRVGIVEPSVSGGAATATGMGPCQGRIRGPAVQTIFGWKNPSIRPPLFPVPLSALFASTTSNETLQLQERP